MKIVIGDKGKSYNVEVHKEREATLYGVKIGDNFDGGVVGAAGYKFLMRGGSDKDGFAMKADVATTAKRRVLLSGPPGYRPKRKERLRRFVRGNTISADIWVNVIAVETGPTPLDQLFPQAKRKERRRGTETVRKEKK